MRPPTPRITVAPHIEPSISIRRRWPAEAIEVIEKDEAEFAGFVEALECDPLFQRLRAEGHVRKVALRGRIPPDRYEAYLDHEAARLIAEHGIADHPDWRRDFASGPNRPSLAALATKYHIPQKVADRITRYFQHLSDEGAQDLGPGRGQSQRWDMEDATAKSTELDQDAVAVCAAFVEAYGLSREDFATDFLAPDQPDPEDIARRYRANLEEVRRVLSAVQRTRVFDVVCESRPASVRTAPGPAHVEDEVVAAVERDSATGVPRLTFLEGSEYAMTYQLRPSAFRALDRLAEDPKDAQDLLQRLRLINQRKSLIYRMVTTLFRIQYEYFVTADETRLRPLPQAELARRLKEDASTISRIIRRKRLLVDGRRIPLQYLCQRLSVVVGRLTERFAQLSDRQLQEKLEREYGCSVSRRTVNYHRQKFQRRVAGRRNE